MRRIFGCRVRTALVLAVGLSGSPRVLVAQQAADPPVTLTLSEALRRALENSPQTKGASLGVEAAEGRLVQAGLRPNPSIAVDLENLFGDARGLRDAEASVELSRRLETGGKRDARIAVARADRSLAGRDLEAARLDLVRDVRRDFVEGVAAQRRLALADESLSIAREVAATAEKKVEAGALPAVEAIRARVAIATAEIESERAREFVRLALERLALHWGGDPVPPRVAGDLDSLASVPDLDALLVRLRENPELARWTDQEELQRARLRLARSGRIPDLELGGGYRHSLAEETGGFLIAASVELPLLHRNQGDVREAEADLARNSLDAERIRRELEGELRAQVARLRIAQAEVRSLRRYVLPGAHEVYEGVRRGYEQGRFTYLDVLEARRSLTEANEAEIAALAELEQSRLEVDRLIGQAPVTQERAKEGGK